MQQQLMQMQPKQQQPIMAAGPFTANNITTDHIQQYLDENKSLIMKILENQNSGKQGECAEHVYLLFTSCYTMIIILVWNQVRLQLNLMYLAAIADCQPQPSSIYAQHTLMQPGTNYLQQQQSQESVMAARSPIFRVHMLQSEETSGSRVVVAASPRNKENGSQSSAENRGGEGESL
ncbi:hypothetical protein LguiA_020480 [Lonicera macranthoides]